MARPSLRPKESEEDLEAKLALGSRKIRARCYACKTTNACFVGCPGDWDKKPGRPPSRAKEPIEDLGRKVTSGARKNHLRCTACKTTNACFVGCPGDGAIARAKVRAKDKIREAEEEIITETIKLPEPPKQPPFKITIQAPKVETAATIIEPVVPNPLVVEPPKKPQIQNSFSILLRKLGGPKSPSPSPQPSAPQATENPGLAPKADPG